MKRKIIRIVSDKMAHLSHSQIDNVVDEIYNLFLEQKVIPEVEGSHPVVLYFEDDIRAKQFVEAVAHEKGLRARKL